MALELLPQFQKVAVKQRARDYLVDGARYQRVTTALGIINKPALIGWAKRVTLDAVEDILRDPSTIENLELLVHEGAEQTKEYSAWVTRMIRAARDTSNKQKNEAADLGTEAHKWIERELQYPGNPEDPYEESGIRREVPDELLPAFDGALRFLADYQIDLIATEQVVWDSDLEIAGTFDGAGYRDGKLVIFDWKRSKGIYWEYALQLGAYAHCLRNVTGLQAVEAFAVRLPRVGDDFEYEAKQVDNLEAATAAYLNTLELHRASKIDWWEDSPNE